MIPRMKQDRNDDLSTLISCNNNHHIFQAAIHPQLKQSRPGHHFLLQSPATKHCTITTVIILGYPNVLHKSLQRQPKNEVKMQCRWK